MVRLALLATLLLGLVQPARGQDACAAETARLCPRPDDNVALLKCLRSNAAQLSAACTSQLDLVLAKALEVGAGCEADVAEFCKDVPVGQGAVGACLKANKVKVSASCQEALNRWSNLQMEVGVSCRNDINKWCSTLYAGDGRILGCLLSHEKELESDCRSTLKKR
jgi:inosine-uridine nucleoside N-ribohydrolase